MLADKDVLFPAPVFIIATDSVSASIGVIPNFCVVALVSAAADRLRLRVTLWIKLLWAEWMNEWV